MDDSQYTTSLTDFLKTIPVRKPRVKKAKRTPQASRYDLKALYCHARRIGFEREYPAAWAAGEYFDKDMPDIFTTNGTQRYIEDVINNYGYHAERINTMGIPVKQPDGSIKWRRSGSTVGSPDIHCVVKNTTWKIEVKKDGDTMRKGQAKYQEKMQRLNILHTVLYVGELDLFWDEFNRILTL